jgi:fatty acid desaturase
MNLQQAPAEHAAHAQPGNADQRIAWYRSPLEPTVLAELTARSDARGWLQAGGHMLLLLCTGAAAYAALSHQQFAWTVPALLLHGSCYAFLGWAGASHELLHRTVFKSRRYNDFFLALYAFLSWNNHVYFRASHLRHHQKTVYSALDGEVRLPQTLRYRDWFWSLTLDVPGLRRALRIVLDNSLGIIRGQWGAQLFPDAPAQRAVVRCARTILCGHLALAALFVWSGCWPLLLLVTLAPFTGNWLSKVLAQGQHFGMQGDVPDFRLNSRTILLHPLIAFLYWQMNYHVEHHMYPGVPFFQLDALRQRLRGDLPAPTDGVRALLAEMATAQRRQDRLAGSN